MPASEPGHRSAWKARQRAFRNLPLALRLVWEAGKGIVTAALLLRIAASILPVGMLAVGRIIVDLVAAKNHTHLWFWIGLEFGLAALGALMGRAIGFCDSLLADRFSRHLSLKVLRHAASLDLQSYESAEFQDKLERARVQAIDRVALVSSTGTLLQQAIMAATLCASVAWFSPWLLLALIVSLLPAHLRRKPVRPDGL